MKSLPWLLRFKSRRSTVAENPTELLRLLIGDGQEDAVIDGDGTLKESHCSAA